MCDNPLDCSESMGQFGGVRSILVLFVVASHRDKVAF